MAVTPGLLPQLIKAATKEQALIRDHAKVLAKRAQKPGGTMPDPTQTLADQDPAVYDRLLKLSKAIVEQKGANTPEKKERAFGLLKAVVPASAIVAGSAEANPAARGAKGILDLAKKSRSMSRQDIGMGLEQMSNDEIALVGGMRSGPSKGDETRVKYAIYDMAAINKNNDMANANKYVLGDVELFVEDGTGKVRGLVELNIKDKKKGVGRKVVDSLMQSDFVGDLNVHSIKKSAQGFWDKMGAEKAGDQVSVIKKPLAAATAATVAAGNAEANPLGLLRTGNKVRAYRGGSPRIWTEEGEMSTMGGKLSSDEAGAFLSSNPRTASTYAKTGKEGSQVAPVDLDTSDFITIDPPKGQDFGNWNSLSPESVITFSDGKKMTIAEALPDYKYMGKQLDTNLVATLLRTHPMVKGKGVAFNKIQDRGPHIWGATAEEMKDFGAKAFEPQTSYAVWDESVMKGAFAKNKAPGFMNGMVLPVTGGGTVTMMAAGGDDAEAAGWERLASGILTPESARISQRLPTAVARTENPLAENLLIGQPAMEAGETMAKNVPLYRTPDYRLQPGRGRKPEVVAANVQSQMKDNLLYLFDETPASMHQQSKLWYDGANKLSRQFANEYGHSQEAVSGVLAALSPQKDWYQNVSLAERLLDAYSKRGQGVTKEMKKALKEKFGDPKYKDDVKAVTTKSFEDLNDKQKAMWLRSYDEGHNPRSYRIVSPTGEFGDFVLRKDGKEAGAGWGSLTEIGKAVSVLENPSIENISLQMGGQHKVRNFFNNINRPNDPFGDVTIDTHAVAAMHGEPFSGKSIPVLHNFGSTGSASSSKSGAQGTYGLLADAYRMAAGEANVLPREMQSITWEAIRGKYSPQFKAQQKNVDAVADVWNQYKKGKISLEEANRRSTDLAGGIKLPSWYKEGQDISEVKTGITSSFKPQKATTLGPGSVIAAQDETLPEPQVSYNDGLLKRTFGGAPNDGSAEYMQRMLLQDEINRMDAEKKARETWNMGEIRGPQSGLLAGAADTIGRINQRSPMPFLLSAENYLRDKAYGNKPSKFDEALAGAETAGAGLAAYEGLGSAAGTAPGGPMAQAAGLLLGIPALSEAGATLLGINEEQRRERDIEKLREAGLIPRY